jgi:threonine dehydrogenase-like Zn-dependent dehydrogenase
MQSLVLKAPGKLAWTDVREPQLTAKGALVKPIAVSTCDFDHLLVSGRMGLPLPLPIGHEFVAEIVAVGEEVQHFRPANKVIVPLQISCGQCQRCKSGRTASCEAVPWLSVYGLGLAAGNWGGAMSDLIAIPYADAMLLALPAHIHPHHAPCLSCNLPDAARCVVPQLQTRPGAEVFITAGAFDNIALYALILAKIHGSAQVDIYGLPESMWNKAEALGGRILRSKQEVRANRYPITVDASRNVELLHLAIDATAPAGELTASVMYTDPQTSLPLLKMFEKCMHFSTGQPDVRASVEQTLMMMDKHSELFATVIDEVMPWQEGARAFTMGPGKRVLVRD